MTDEKREAAPAATGPLWTNQRISSSLGIINDAMLDYADSFRVDLDVALKVSHSIRDDLQAEIDRLNAELTERDASFELRNNADMRAIAMWQEATDKELMWPNHADMCVWLMEELDRLREELAEARANERKPMRVFRNTLGDDALISYLMDDEGTQMNSDVLDTIEAALDKARRLAGIAIDWNLDEVEINCEMVNTYSLIDEFDAALAELARLREAGPQPNWDDAPEWAEWWTVDADGATAWWQKKPRVLGFEWWTKDEDINNPDLWEHCEDTAIPLGVDWRTLIRRRTQAGRQDGE